MRKRWYHLVLSFAVVLALASVHILTFVDCSKQVPAMVIVVLGAYMFISTLVGFVFGFDRGAGRLLSPDQLIPGKPFNITNVLTLTNGAIIYITVGGKTRRCFTAFAPPEGTTHLRVKQWDSGTSEFEFVKITPEVIEVLMHS